MGVEMPIFISNFPGVPAFFFVSGFLIYASYLNAPGASYFKNRFLRLFPGLVFVTIGGGVVGMVAHGGNDLFHNFSQYLFWFVAQTTLGQAYNPMFFRDVGVGVINGSLWTLTVEIMFYITVPIIVWLERKFRFTVLTLLIISFGIYIIGPIVWSEKIYRDKTFYDFIALTPLAWGWMFAFGILAVKNFDFMYRRIKWLVLLVLPLTAMAMFGDASYFYSTGNRLGIFYFVCYVGLVLWLAFATPVVRLKFDFSYGLYIWHAPVINLLLVLGYQNTSLALALTFVMGSLSWFMIEKPALKLKTKSLHAVD